MSAGAWACWSVLMIAGLVLGFLPRRAPRCRHAALLADAQARELELSDRLARCQEIAVSCQQDAARISELNSRLSAGLAPLPPPPLVLMVPLVPVPLPVPAPPPPPDPPLSCGPGPVGVTHCRFGDHLIFRSGYGPWLQWSGPLNGSPAACCHTAGGTPVSHTPR